MGRLIAQDFAIELQTPFRTTAIITGIAQFAMIFVAAMAPWLIRRFGLSTVFIIALIALPIRGLLASAFTDFWVIFPVQFLDGVGAGLLGIVTPVAVERILKGTGRFNVGLASVMMVQGIGASFSNVVAGWLVTKGGYSLSLPEVSVLVLHSVSISVRVGGRRLSDQPADEGPSGSGGGIKRGQ